MFIFLKTDIDIIQYINGELSHSSELFDTSLLHDSGFGSETQFSLGTSINGFSPSLKQEPDLTFSTLGHSHLSQPDLSPTTTDLAGHSLTQNALKSLLEFQDTRHIGVKQEPVLDPLTNGGIVADTDLDPTVALLTTELSPAALKTLLELNNSAHSSQLRQAAVRLQQIQLAKQKQLQQQLLLQQQQQRQQQLQQLRAAAAVSTVQTSGKTLATNQQQLKLILQQPLVTTVTTAPVATRISAKPQQMQQMAAVQVVSSQPMEVNAATTTTQNIGQVSLQQLQQVSGLILSSFVIN